MFSFASFPKRRSFTELLHSWGRWCLWASHHSLAFLGVSVLAMALFVAGHAEIRETFETKVLDWLQARYDGRAQAAADEGGRAASLDASDAVSRVTAAHASELTRQQASVARWISRRYRVAPEPISRLVKEAWLAGARSGLDPTLILAIMAVESGFNPFAQSSVGAQGLMQVMTRVHNDKFERFGGILATFDPVTNLTVGVQVLQECIRRAGNIKAGLRSYVGAANHAGDGGYAGKVLALQARLQNVAAGVTVPTTVPVLAMPEKSIEVPTEEPAEVGDTNGEDIEQPEHVALLS